MVVVVAVVMGSDDDDDGDDVDDDDWSGQNEWSWSHMTNLDGLWLHWMFWATWSRYRQPLWSRSWLIWHEEVRVRAMTKWARKGVTKRR